MQIKLGCQQNLSKCTSTNFETNLDVDYARKIEWLNITFDCFKRILLTIFNNCVKSFGVRFLIEFYEIRCLLLIHPLAKLFTQQEWLRLRILTSSTKKTTKPTQGEAFCTKLLQKIKNCILKILTQSWVWSTGNSNSILNFG